MCRICTGGMFLSVQQYIWFGAAIDRSGTIGEVFRLLLSLENSEDEVDGWRKAGWVVDGDVLSGCNGILCPN